MSYSNFTTLKRYRSRVAFYCLDADSLRGRFLGGAFWALAGSAVSRGLTLIGAIGTGRVLGIARFGELGIVQSTASMFAVFAGMGLGITATKFIADSRARAHDRSGQYIDFFLRMTTISGFVLSVIYLIALPTLRSALPPSAEISSSLQIATGLLFFGALNGTGLGVLSGLEAFRSIATVGILRGALTAMLVLAGVAVWDVRGGIIGMVLAESLSFLLILALIRTESHRRGIETKNKMSSEEWSILWRFTFPALLGSVIVLPSMWISNLILVRHGGFDQMGIYSAALKWNQLILFLPSSIAGIVLPMLSNRHGAGD